MNTSVAPQQTRMDTEGYLVEPGEWNEAVARKLATTEAVHLEQDHWKVIHFMRDFYEEHQVAADARYVIKYLAEEAGYGKEAKRRLFELFPYGYVKQACKIAGMKRPRAWSTG